MFGLSNIKNEKKLACEWRITSLYVYNQKMPTDEDYQVIKILNPIAKSHRYSSHYDKQKNLELYESHYLYQRTTIILNYGFHWLKLHSVHCMKSQSKIEFYCIIKS